MEANRHENWIDIAGRKQFRSIFFQSVDDFVESPHSQVTWSRDAMGQELSKKFDAELRELMILYSQEGKLRSRIHSTLTWGKPRSTPIVPEKLENPER